jgi:iron complex transport system permease protein
MRGLVLILATLVLVTLSFLTGPNGVEFPQFSDEFKLIFFEIRFPRTMAALFVGAALGLSGLLLQSLTKNALSEPFTLGISGGASLGAVSMIALGQSSFVVGAGGLMGSWLTTLIILLTMRLSRFSENFVVLTGMMISFFCGSIVTLIIAFLSPDQIMSSVYWMMGQLGTSRDHHWPALSILVLVSMALVTFKSKSLDGLLVDSRLGPSLNAQALGSHKNANLYLVVLLVTALTSVSVSIAGLIGFVGLTAPHIAKWFSKSVTHKKRAIYSAFVGANLLLLSDFLARWIGGDRSVPSGGLMAVMGAPILVYILIRRGGKQ